MNDTSVSDDESTVLSKSRVIAYIDGFNLYYGLKKASKEADVRHIENGGLLDDCLGRSLYWLDIPAVVLGQLHPSEECVAIKYYSAPRKVSKHIRPTPEERARLEASNERQRILLEALATLPLMDMHLGYYSEKNPHRCPNCAHRWPFFEEKCTDVNIATQMVVDGYENKFDLAIVMSADADLVAPIKAVQALGKSVRLLLPPGRKRAKHLRKVVDDPREITIKTLRGLTLPDTIARQHGLSPLCRPDAWNVPGTWVWNGIQPTPLNQVPVIKP
jgi:hypothetical protein